MRQFKKALAVLLAVCILCSALPVTASAADSGDYYRIVHLDSGREYFSADWIIALLHEMDAAGYNQLQLAFGNGGFRFYLDDMSVGSYDSDTVKAAVEAGNEHYNTYGDDENGPNNSEWIAYDPAVNALTQSEMDRILAEANALGIDIVPMFNTPGHMHALLNAMEQLGMSSVSVKNGCLNLDNASAVSFTKTLIGKYADYFAAKGCKYFNLATDEYSSFNSTFFSYANALIDIVTARGMRPRMFNDALASGTVSNSSSYPTEVCYWYSSSTRPSTIANKGYSLINTNHDYYYVSTNEYWNLYREGYTFVGDYNESTWVAKAKQFSNTTFYGSSYSSPVGSMFCIWCNTPGKNDETAIAQQIRMILRVLGARMQGSSSYSGSDVIVSGGFNADGTLNETHTWAESARQDATCTAPGSVTYTCADCGETKTEELPALGHAYQAADDGGDTVYTCSRCGDTYTEALPREAVSLEAGESKTVTLPGHQTITASGDTAVAEATLDYTESTGSAVSYSASASASVSGYTSGGYNCVVSKVIDGSTSTYYWSTASQQAGQYVRVDLGAEVRFDAVQVSSPAHGDYCSNANVQVSSDAKSWTTLGTHTGSSSRIVTNTYEVPDTVESFRYIQVVLTGSRNYWWQLAEIAWGSYDNGTFTRAATSGTVNTGTEESTTVTFTGKKAGETWFVIDGTRYVVTVQGEVHQHDYTERVTKEATCEAKGERTFTCACGDSYTEEIPALGHDYTERVTAPTCEAKGYTTYTCSRCGDSYTGDETDALGHDYTERVTKEATCEAAGERTFTCGRCGDAYTEEIPATGHSYTAKVTKTAGCETEGERTFTCSRCGDSYTKTIAALGHSYETTSTDATCETAGSVTHTCSRCGDSYSETVAALGHDYTERVTAPTCETKGYTTYTCSRCGDSYTGDETDALGHDYTERVTEPTCESKGYTTYTCSRCDKSYTGDETAALGHDYTARVTEPTCESKGFTTYTCSRCDKSYTADETAALGHAYTARVTKEATCTADGERTFTCSRCGDAYTETIPATGHDYEASEQDGVTVYTCKHCGDSYTEALNTEEITLAAGKTTELVLDGTLALTASGDTAIATAALTHQDAASSSVSYSASASASLSGYTDGGYYCVPAKVIDGSTSTYYWSTASQQAGQYVRVDLGAEVRFDAVQVSSPAHGDYCSNANVQVSSDAKSWTTLGTHTGSSSRIVTNTYAVPDTVESFRYIQVVLTGSRNYWWQLAEIAWGSYDNGTFTRAAASGTLVTETKAQTTVTFKALQEGQTWFVIGDTRYVITVPHSHSYTGAVTTPAGCETEGVRTFTCACGDSYTEAIPALGHDYAVTETETELVYTCTRCGDSYSKPRTSYEQTSSLTSGKTYVVTVYTDGTYYALTHNGTTLSLTAVTVENGQVTSELSDAQLWSYNGKLGYTSGSTTRYLYAASRGGWGGWGGGWNSLTSISLSTSGSSVTYSGSSLKLGNSYLYYSNGSVYTNRSYASTCYVFELNN